MNSLQDNLVPFVPLVQGARSTNGASGTNEYRYIFEKGNKKHSCPNCNKKRFVRYIDTLTENYLPEQYGRCDRESKCGYFLNPYKDGYAKAIWEQKQCSKTDWKPRQPKLIKKPKIEFIPVEVFKQTLSNYDKNIFIQNLLNKIAFPFDNKSIETVISLYRLGTVPETGAVCFPYIDVNQNIRAVQEKIFDANNQTDKSIKYHTNWIHKTLPYREYKNKPLPDWLKAYNQNEKIVTCLFGEHLLHKYPNNPVALVEAPKTAIYGTLYFGFPENSINLLWLSVSTLRGLTLDKCKPLKNRNVYLFPDLSKDGKAFELWDKKAKCYQKQIKGSFFKVSDLLENLAPENHKEKGNDLADYLIKLDWRKFRETLNNNTEVEQDESDLDIFKVNKTIESYEVEDDTSFYDIFKTENPQEEVAKWDEDINTLENFFKTIKLPEKPLKLNQCSTILNVQKFVNSHFLVVKAQNGNNTFLPYLERLQKLRSILD